jgi:hypothetical protein
MAEAIEQQVSEDDVFGTAKYGGEGYKKAKKLEKGETVVRVLPPVKSLRTSGKWKIYHKVHFGYYGRNKKNASEKPWAKPFLCIEEKDRETKMITKECAECALIRERTAERDERAAQIKLGLGRSVTEQAVKSALKGDAGLKAFNDWLFKHNLDSNFYINVKFENGEIGPLAIRYKAEAALSKVFDEVRKKKIDPMHPSQGIWVSLSRAGEMISTTYSAQIVNEKVVKDGEELERRKPAALTADDVRRCINDAVDLTTAHGATALTEAQIKALTQSEGDSEVVDAIFDQAQKAANPEVAPGAVPSVPKLSAPAPIAKASAPVVVDDEEAKAEAALAAIKAKKAAAAAAAKAPQGLKPAVPTPGVEDLDVNKFIEEYGDPSQG